MRRPGVRVPCRPPDFKGLTSYWEGGDPRFFNLNAMLENEVIAALHVSLRARWPRGALQEFQSLVASSALHLLLEFIKGEEGRTLLSRYAGKQLSTHIDLRELQQRLNSFETEGHALTDTPAISLQQKSRRHARRSLGQQWPHVNRIELAVRAGIPGRPGFSIFSTPRATPTPTSNFLASQRPRICLRRVHLHLA